MNTLPKPDELQVLQSLVDRGAELTRTTETLSMVSSTKAAAPILSDIRAVDPRAYPFYGKVELEPSMPLREALTEYTTVVSPDLLMRADVSLGETVQIGAARFLITALLKSEPDRIAFGVDIGPRILITRKGLERSGLIQFGSRVAESFLYRLPAKGLSLEDARNTLSAGISRRVRITDYRNPNPSVSRGLERTADFLSLIGLLALLVGGLGVSMTVHTYLQQKIDSIAILKCLGGRSAQIIRIYMIQGLILGTAGSMIGVGLGYLLQLILPRLLKGMLELPTQLELAPGAALQGFSLGILTTLLFLVPPLLATRKISPVRIFLREMPETRYSTWGRLRRDPIPLASALILLVGVGSAASWLAESFRWGLVFLAALIGCVLVLALSARLLLILLKRAPRPSSLALRQGLKNLNRPGNHATSILVALGLGSAFVLVIHLIQFSLISQIVKSAPADFPNVFLLGITDREKPELEEFLNSHNGIQTQALIPMCSSRLYRIDGKRPDQMELDPLERRRMRGEFMLTWSEDIPPDTRIVEGRWWKPPYDSPKISVLEYAARHFKIGIGSVVEFDVGGRMIRGEVVNIRDAEFARPGTSSQFIFSPGSLKGLPASYIGTIRMSPSQTAAFQSALFKRFPNVTSIDVGQVLAKVQELLDKIAAVIRFVAIFAILSGVIILASSVVSTRLQRIREAALLKTLGATRSQLVRMQTVEFLILGSAAGFMGGILAIIAAHFLLGRLLNAELDFQWSPLLACTAATAILAVTTGWLASRGILNHKPLEILREN